jgi:hypothetical protein
MQLIFLNKIHMIENPIYSKLENPIYSKVENQTYSRVENQTYISRVNCIHYRKAK